MRNGMTAYWKLSGSALRSLCISGDAFGRKLCRRSADHADFRKEDLDVIEIGTWALRFQCVTLPLSAWIVMSNMMTQTIGYASALLLWQQDVRDYS